MLRRASRWETFSDDELAMLKMCMINQRVGMVISDYPMLGEIQGEIERRPAIPTALDPDDPGEPVNSL